MCPRRLQISPTSVPPLAEPLHWVIVAPDVVAGKGSQTIVVPIAPDSPDPTHWFTVDGRRSRGDAHEIVGDSHAATEEPPSAVDRVVALGDRGDRLGQASLVVTVHVASGTPAEPWHSRTVTSAVPPVGVIVLTTVASQTAPPVTEGVVARRGRRDRGRGRTCREGKRTEEEEPACKQDGEGARHDTPP